MSTPDSRDQMHLATGTLDTSGFGEGDLRDVALVYRTEPPQARTEARDTVNAEIPVATAITTADQPPLFTEDGEPTAQAMPSPSPPKIGDQVPDTETGIVSEFDGTSWIELSPEAAPVPHSDSSEPDQELQADTEPTSAATKTTPADIPPVDQTARAGKESKPPAGAARARRSKAAG